MDWELVVLASNRSFPLEAGKEYVVGSAASVHLRLPAPDVSGTHALLTVHPKHVLVVDLGSKNGTFLNGRRITAAQAVAGDMLAFSSVKTLLLRAEDPRAAARHPEGGEPFRERDASHTAEFPALAVEVDLAELVGLWAAAPQNAVETLLSWLAGRREALGCAFLEYQGRDLRVLAAQGTLLPECLQAARELVAKAKPASRWDVVELASCGQKVCLGELGGGMCLLLVPAKTSPSPQEAMLYGQLARLALHLAGVART